MKQHIEVTRRGSGKVAGTVRTVHPGARNDYQSHLRMLLGPGKARASKRICQEKKRCVMEQDKGTEHDIFTRCFSICLFRDIPQQSATARNSHQRPDNNKMGSEKRGRKAKTGVYPLFEHNKAVDCQLREIWDPEVSVPLDK